MNKPKQPKTTKTKCREHLDDLIKRHRFLVGQIAGAAPAVIVDLRRRSGEQNERTAKMLETFIEFNLRFHGDHPDQQKPKPQGQEVP